MKFPTSFPADDLSVLMDFFRSANRGNHSKRAYAEASLGLLAFAVGQVIPEEVVDVPDKEEKTRMVASAKMECLPDDRCLVVLEDMKEAHNLQGDRSEAHQRSKALDWRQIISVIVTVLQQIGPLFG